MKPEKSRRAAHTLAWSICVSLLFWALHGPVLGGRRNEPISVPGAGWELAVKRGAFTLADDRSNSAGTSRVMSFEHSDGRLSFTVTMQPASASPEKTRAGMRGSLGDEETQRGGEREWERGETLFLEYVADNPKNTTRTKHVYAFLAAGETSVEVHVVKNSFKQYQQKTLDSLTDSLEIIR